jgi:hypothetical protein
MGTTPGVFIAVNNDFALKMEAEISSVTLETIYENMSSDKTE